MKIIIQVRVILDKNSLVIRERLGAITPLIARLFL
jgi:hypothetical protein